MNLRCLLAVGFAFVFLPGAAAADEISDTIKAAAGHYEQDRLGQAATLLQIALGKLRDRLETRLQATIPGPPDDWTSQEAHRPPPHNYNTMLGSNIQRTYTSRTGGRITISLMLDNPMAWPQAATYIGLMAPGYAEQMGYTRLELEGLGGGAALYRWTDRSNNGEGVILIPGRLVIRLNGYGAAAAQPMRALMPRFDIKRIREIAGIE